MAAPFIPAVDITSFRDGDKGLSPAQLLYVGTAYAVATQANLETTLGELNAPFQRLRYYLNVTLIPDIDTIVSLLNAGAAKVFVTRSQLEELRQCENITSDRLVLSPTGQVDDELNSLVDNAVGIFLQGMQNPELIEGLLKALGTRRPPIFVSLASPSTKHVIRLAQLGATPIIPAQSLTMDAKACPELIDSATLLWARLFSDRPDNLVQTIVADERGTALGAVNSNLESISESLRLGRGVYISRKRGLWHKGETTGDIQELVRIESDCDNDCLRFIVRQKGRGFCHLSTATCFGEHRGLSKLEKMLQRRKIDAPTGSYTARLFNDPNMLKAKILEEANELCDASEAHDIAAEAADLIYFALAKCAAAGVSLEDVENNLDQKSAKVKRRKGDAKAEYAAKFGVNGTTSETLKEAASIPKHSGDPAGRMRIKMRRYVTSQESQETIAEVLKRPSQKSTETIMGIVDPIIKSVRQRGDAALLEYTQRFEKATSLKSPVLRAPFASSLREISAETKAAIDTSFDNIRKFHAAQSDDIPLIVETMPGVVCSRFSRPIHSVGLYIPGGTAVLPSTTLMLGIPAMVAGCKRIVIASPPRADGSISPEIVYVAHRVGAETIVLAGGAQAVAAMAYGTESVPKVDKILGPGNQFVTAAKMIVSNDTTAGVSIDMPAGPSEVLVIADASANPAFVASDLLSQAEHGVDSQVILIAVGLDEAALRAIEDQLHAQANALPRVDIVRGAIEHSVTLVVNDMVEAMKLSNMYAPEHLILQVENAGDVVQLVENAGSVFVGHWTPESVGDYSAGVNHSLPTYGYAKQYSGVNLASYVKHITSANLTRQGLCNVGGAVMQLAKVEELEAHRRAVSIRLDYMNKHA